MDVDYGLVPGVAVSVVALVMGVALAVITYRFSRGRSMVTAMLQTSFLPEKRQRYLVLLSVEGCLMLLIGIVWGLTASDALPGPVGNTAVAFLLILGAGTVGSLTWLGFSPGHLTAEERRSLASQAPAMFQSLLMAPLQLDAEATEFVGHVRTRTHAPAIPKSTADRPPPKAPPVT
jgi:hypothetical protein